MTPNEEEDEAPDMELLIEQGIYVPDKEEANGNT